MAKENKSKAAQLIKGIQNALGVDDNTMIELWQNAINKYGSEDGIVEAINQATQGLTQDASEDEIKAAIASVFTQDSQMFKCGGKLAALFRKFGNGGKCGCSKVVKGQDSIPGGMPDRVNSIKNVVKNLFPVGGFIGVPVGGLIGAIRNNRTNTPVEDNVKSYNYDSKTYYNVNGKPYITEINEDVPGLSRTINKYRNGVADTTLVSNNGIRHASPHSTGLNLFEERTIPSKEAWSEANSKIDRAKDAELLSERQGGIVKGQNGIPDGTLTDKITTVKGPSIGQRGLGVIRPWITQHIIYNQQANPDTLYFGKNVNAFDSSLPINITERETMVLPQSVRNKLANIVDSDYSEYNASRGSYPNGYYEKTIDTKYRKKK